MLQSKLQQVGCSNLIINEITVNYMKKILLKLLVVMSIVVSCTDKELIDLMLKNGL